MIATATRAIIDAPAWNSALAEEDANRAVLADASQNWSEVENFLRER
jgi:hypothetical protein